MTPYLVPACVSRLRRAVADGHLARLDPAEIDRLLDNLMARDWVVYSKPCLTHTETVVDYLGRYSHRIALSDARLVNFDGERVALRYKDYRDGARQKVRGWGQVL
ncbi:transposase [Thioalkalicoccus limnaeus]|uniref:Transposase n=1 Tax=Thioalkalicoccus limnaeus TaxID=120681 RepID=A0ABV4BHY1_9GAMM